jgi:hypothetical protein
MSRKHGALLLVAALGAMWMGASAARQLRQSPSTAYYELRVTAAVGAPDCYQKTVILVNGQFQATTVEVKQGDILVVRMPLVCTPAVLARACVGADTLPLPTGARWPPPPRL